MNVLDHSRAIDLQQLLQPIPGANPAGESLRYEGTYDRIVDARREDDPALSQGIYRSNLKRADWATVETICIEYDRTFFVRSKKAIHSINNIRPCLVYVMLKCGDIVGFYVFFICFVRILILLAYHL